MILLVKIKRGPPREPTPMTHDNFLNLFLNFTHCKVIFKAHSHSRAASVFHSFRSRRDSSTNEISTTEVIFVIDIINKSRQNHQTSNFISPIRCRP